jgi:4'-phosphopantetheinyl transferase
MEILWPPAPDSFELSPERRDVWAVRLEAEPAAVHNLAATLSPVERQRAERFRLGEPRRRFVVSRAALRSLLGRYLASSDVEVALETDSSGKPRLAAGQSAVDVQFNIAHSGDLALIAITVDCEIGVDVEQLRSVAHVEHIARRFFHPTETRAILAAPAEERDAVFLRYWTGKEAILKAIGRGITGGLASFCVPADEFGDTRIELPQALSSSHSRCWLHALQPCAGYVGAVAWLGYERPVRHFVFNR